MLILLLTVSFFFKELPVKAESTSLHEVVVNEVMWAGMQYIELFNTTEEDIDLKGWTLTRERLVGGEVRIVTIELEEGDKILAGGYFVLERKTLSDNEPSLLFTSGLGKIIRGSALMLVNAGERLELRNSTGELIDEVNRLDSWYAGFNGGGITRSMERVDPDKLGTDRCNWQTYAGEEITGNRLGTPAQENSEFINPLEAVIEVASSYVLKGEAVELDGGSSRGFDNGNLTYKWDFGDGHSEKSKIGVHSYEAVGQYEVMLTVSDCDLEDTATVTIDVSEELDDIVIDDSSSDYKKVALKDVRRNSAGQLMRVEGIVSVLPGTFGPRIIYLTDPSLSIGLQIYFFQANWPTLKLGDKLRVDGELTTVLGERRLKVADFKDVSVTGGSVVPAPHAFKTGQVNEAVEGALITVSGKVTSSSGNTFYIDDGSGELRIVVNTATGIKKPSTRRGTSIKVTGIVSRTTIGYRLMPRFQSDIEVLLSEHEEGDEQNEEGQVAGENIKEVALKDIREEELGEYVVTEGVISVPPGVLGDRIAYLAGSGIQLYFHSAAWPDLALGDKVRVTGELASSLGEARLKITEAIDITKVDKGKEPQPRDVATGSIGKDLEGSLVKVVGRITKTSGSTFYIDDGSGEVRIVIQASTKIEKPRTTKGTPASIIGVVSHTNSGYRVLPRFQSDVAFGDKVAGLKSFPAAGFLKMHTQSGSKANIIYFFGGAVVMLLFSSAYHSGEPLLRVKKRV